MGMCIITLVSIALAIAGLFFTGLFRVGLDALIDISNRYYQKRRRAKRPPRIFLIRHGESEANLKESLYSSMPDSEIQLTEKGHQQAIEAGKKLRSIIGDETMYIYVSPYLRSKQTWENIKKAFSSSQVLAEREEPHIRELELGNIDNAENLSKEIGLQMQAKRFFYRFSGGESPADVYDRVSLFLATLFRDVDNGVHDRTQNIVICSHGLTIKFYLMRYFGWEVAYLQKLRHFDNCEIVQLNKVDGAYILDGKINLLIQSS